MVNTKQFLVAALGLSAMLMAFSAPASAAFFSDFVDFGDPGFGPTGAIEVVDSDGFFWTHDINDNLGGNAIGDVVLTDATLTISYGQVNGNTNSELWLIYGDGIQLGSLPGTANANEILTIPFLLTADALALLQADGLFTVVPTETTNGRDAFMLYESTLSGNYTGGSTSGGGDQPGIGDPSVAPEPASLGLLGMGLLGMMKRRRKSA